MVEGVRAIADLPDPVGEVIAEWDRPNGLHIERVRTPLGVIGVIFESRPNVTADAGALCLKSGNAGDPARRLRLAQFVRAIHACLVEGLQAAGLPEDAIQLVPTTDRAAVGEMLQGLAGNLDVIVPRGGKSLVARVQDEARVPVFAHLEGICHVYIDSSADLDMAVSDRGQRQDAAHRRLRRGRDAAGRPSRRRHASRADHRRAGRKAGCEIRGDATRCVTLSRQRKPATEEDWTTEYLDAIISVKLVDGVDEAIAHIEHYSLAPHRGDHHRRCGGGRALLQRDRLGDPAAQCLDPVRRWRRVRLRRRDRHRHRQDACARAGRRRAAHLLQVPRPRGADKYDYREIAYGAPGLHGAGSVLRHFWKNQDDTSSPILGIFDERNTMQRGARFIRERIHLLGFCWDERYESGSLVANSYYLGNPALFDGDEAAEAVYRDYPLRLLEPA